MDYPAFVSSIVKPGLEIHASLDAVKCRILHMTLGIMNEFVEYEHNVKKLSARYPAGYSDKDARERKDKQ